MKLNIYNGLPQSHKEVTIEVSGEKIPGTVWDKKDIHPDTGTLNLYTGWPAAMFGNPWFGIEAKDIVSEDGTQRDIELIHKTLGKQLQSAAKIIDVHCGTGRHAIALAKKGYAVIGLDEVVQPLQVAEANAAQEKIECVFVLSDYDNHLKYQNSADIVISMFNSMGYQFSQLEDQKQLNWTIKLLKPGGHFFLDVRSEKFQKEHYTQATISRQKLASDITMTTTKFWENSILGAEEEIIVEKEDKKTIAQHMTYGWRTYSLDEMEEMLAKAGAEIVSVTEDYYRNADNVGERILLVAKRKI